MDRQVDVFICHAEQDEPLAERLFDALQKAELHPWCGALNLIPGDLWQEERPRYLKQARIVAVLITPRWPAAAGDGTTHYVREEVLLAINQVRSGNSALVPILVDGAGAERVYGLGRFTPIEAHSLDMRPIVDGLLKKHRKMLGQQAQIDPADPVRVAMKEREDAERAGVPAEILDDLDQRILDLKRRRLHNRRPSAGLRLSQRWYLRQRLGQGGFAEVWRAWDLHLNSYVAVKLLHAQHDRNEERRRRFFGGSMRMAQLDHPGIVQVIQPKNHDHGWYFFVMEYLEGGDLDAALTQGKIGRTAALTHIAEAATALGYAHQKGWVHRDVKPANIILGADGRARLSDFDLVWAPDTTAGTRVGQVLGTYHYTAPEVLESADVATAQSDVYSLGMCSLAALAGGRLSHAEARDPHAVLAGVGGLPRTKAVLTRALDADPGRRQPDGRAFSHDLEAALQDDRSSGHASVAENPAPADGVDRFLEELNTHRRCLEADLADLLAFSTIRDCWRGMRAGLPHGSTRCFLQRGLWSGSQSLVDVAKDSWTGQFRPFLEDMAYRDWQRRRDDLTLSDGVDPPPDHIRALLVTAGWLGIEQDTLRFVHWRLASWVLASAVARRGMIEPQLMSRIDVDLTRQWSPAAHDVEPELSREFPGDLIWHFIYAGHSALAASLLSKMWRRGWHAEYLCELFVEIGPRSLSAIQIQMESLAQDLDEGYSVSNYEWLQKQRLPRMTAQDVETAERWCLRACSHSRREIREIAYSVAAACATPSTMECLWASACRWWAAGQPYATRTTDTLEGEAAYHEGRWIVRQMKSAIGSDPSWLAEYATTLVEANRHLATMLLDGLAGHRGKEAWLRIKETFFDGCASSDWFQLNALIRRFRDVSETERSLGHLAVAHDDPQSDEYSALLHVRDATATIAVLAPSLVPRAIADLPAEFIGRLSPGRVLRSLFWRDSRAYLQTLEVWLERLDGPDVDGTAWSLSGVTDIMPVPALSRLLSALRSADLSLERRGWKRLVDCVASAKSLRMLHLLEGMPDDPLAEKLFRLSLGQLRREFGHVLGDAAKLTRRIGGRHYRAYAVHRLGFGQLEFRRGFRDLPFVPGPVPWARVEQAEEAYGEDDFTMGIALAIHGQYERLVSWILTRGLSGAGRRFSELEPDSGTMDTAVVEIAARALEGTDYPNTHALLALGMTGNPHAVATVCDFHPESDDERYIRAVALRWLGGRSTQLLDRVVSSLPDGDRAVLVDVLWNTRSVGAAVVRRHAESLLVERLLGESWSFPRPSVTDGLQRHDRLRLAVRAVFDELNWPPKECMIACWGRWPGRDALTWSESDLRNAIRNGPSHEPVKDELIRYHELSPKRAYDLALDILRNGYRSTSGLPGLLIHFDTEQAVRDLWEICIHADIRLRHEIAVRLDEVEPRHFVEEWLFDKMVAGRPADRRMAAWLLGWQTDRLLHDVLKTRLDADVDANSQILKALERQHTAHEALQLLLDLPGQEPHARLIRVEMFCELCKPTDKASPDGWAVWRRAGYPQLGAPLWERMRDKLRGLRKFDEE